MVDPILSLLKSLSQRAAAIYLITALNLGTMLYEPVSVDRRLPKPYMSIELRLKGVRGNLEILSRQYSTLQLVGRERPHPGTTIARHFLGRDWPDFLKDYLS